LKHKLSLSCPSDTALRKEVGSIRQNRGASPSRRIGSISSGIKKKGGPNEARYQKTRKFRERGERTGNECTSIGGN